MEPITTLFELRTALREANIDDYPHILNRSRLDEETLRPYVSWEKGTYTRNCIDRTEDYELILICWDKNAVTEIHDHDGQKCWMFPLQGQLKEFRFRLSDSGDPEKISETILSCQTLSFIDDVMGCHALSNDTGERAMSLHLYAAPIDQCQVFNESESSFEKTELTYDTDMTDTEVHIEPSGHVGTREYFPQGNQ